MAKEDAQIAYESHAAYQLSVASPIADWATLTGPEQAAWRQTVAGWISVGSFGNSWMVRERAAASAVAAVK